MVPLRADAAMPPLLTRHVAAIDAASFSRHATIHCHADFRHAFDYAMLPL